MSYVVLLCKQWKDMEIIKRWLKYVFLLTLSRAVHCFASRWLLLSASPSSGHTVAVPNVPMGRLAHFGTGRGGLAICRITERPGRFAAFKRHHWSCADRRQVHRFPVRPCRPSSTLGNTLTIDKYCTFCKTPLQTPKLSLYDVTFSTLKKEKKAAGADHS